MVYEKQPVVYRPFWRRTGKYSILQKLQPATVLRKRQQQEHLYKYIQRLSELK